MRKLFILAVAVAFVVTALPAMAAERTVSMYGDVRMATFVHKDSRETNVVGAAAALSTTGFPGRSPSALFSDTDTEWALDTTLSRWGFRVVDGDLSANVEIRSNVASYFRHWYGAWNFGVGSLIVGQTWAPDANGAILDCCQGAGYGGNFGDLGGSSRVQQIALWFPIQAVGGTLKIAGVAPFVSNNTGFAGDTDTSMPKLVGAMDFVFGPVKLYLTAGWNSFDVVNNATDKEYSVDSSYYGGSIVFNTGPITLKGALWGAKNAYEYGFGNSSGLGYYATYWAATDSILDADFMGWALFGGYKFTDMVSLNIGYARISSDLDYPGTRSDEDDSAFWYVRLPITLAKGVVIAPEVGKYDYKDRLVNNVRTEEGDTKYYGAYWHISF
jgi:hypothetical protein